MKPVRKESLRQLAELSISLASLGIISQALSLAFTRSIAYKIKERDSFTCTTCGETNVPVEASHINHNKKAANYNNPKNGETLCRCCHYTYHLNHRDKAHLIGLTEQENDWAIASIYGRLDKDEIKRLYNQLALL